MDLFQFMRTNANLCGLCVQVCPSYEYGRRYSVLLNYIQSGGLSKKTFENCRIMTYGFVNLQRVYRRRPSRLVIRKLVSAARELKQKISAQRREGLSTLFRQQSLFKIGEWEKPVEFKNEGLSSKVVYFPGCAASCMNKVVGRSTVKVLDASGADYSVMSGVEYCCGSVSAGAGNTAPLEKLGQKNIDEINARGSEILITTCPAVTAH